MQDRYTSAKMAEIWSDQARFNYMLDVEIAALLALVDNKTVSMSDAEDVMARVRVDVEDIRRREDDLAHETAAFVASIAESAGPAGERWLHHGLTSSDVGDTALSLQIVDSGALVLEAMERAAEETERLAGAYQHTPMIGRTHGKHAEVITFGLKAAGWAAELARSYSRVHEALGDTRVGKLSGPVGTYPVLTQADELAALSKLDLEPEHVATQVVPRDRLAALLTAMAVAGGTVERIAVAIRLMAQSEVAEVEEGKLATQQGSSAMPHKSNPVKSERLTGLARLLRGYAVAAMENQALWHERDMSHSSVEREIVPGSFSILEFMLDDLTEVLKRLRINEGTMADRANSTEAASSRALNEAVAIGVPRQVAYHAIQVALKWADSGLPLGECVVSAIDHDRRLTEEEKNRLIGACENTDAISRAAAAVNRL